MISSYTNGNVHVEIHEDGTKVRTYDGEAQPAFPESIDLKITNYCDAGCGFCHEASTKQGKHGNLDWAIGRLSGLPAGVELAIGGGNPLSHPDLVLFLGKCKARGWIANLTVHHSHLYPNGMLHEPDPAILKLQEHGLVHGLGLSVADSDSLGIAMGNNHHSHIQEIPNLVIHAVAGVTPVDDFLKMGHRNSASYTYEGDKYERITRVEPSPIPPILILGYKEYGLGIDFEKKHKADVDRNLRRWRYFLPGLLQSGLRVSFDNLALEQLQVRRLLTDEEWNLRFMGHDGEFTMYVDAVRQRYAMSSTGIRMPFEGNDGIAQAFQKIRVRAKAQREAKAACQTN